MATLRRLVVEMAANTAAFQSDMTRAANIAERNLGRIADQGSKTNKAIQSLAVGAKNLFAGFAVAGGIASFGKALGGAAIASEQLQKKLQFATGSVAGAQSAMQFASETANSLGLNAVKAADGFATIAASAKGTAIEGETTREIFLGISQASAALSLSAEDSAGALLAISQMISKGAVSAEELKQQLGERLPGAFQIAARSIGKTTEELGDMLKAGEVMSDDFLPKFAQELQNTFGGAALESSNTLTASINKMQNRWNELLIVLAETGIISAVTRLIDGLGQTITHVSRAISTFIDRFRELKNQSDLVNLANQIEGLEGKITKTTGALRKWQEVGLDANAAEAKKALKEYNEQLRAVQVQYSKVSSAANGLTIEINTGADSAAKAAAAAAAAARAEAAAARAKAEMAAAAKAAALQSKQLNTELRGLIENLDPVSRFTREFGDNQVILNQALDRGAISVAQYGDLVQANTDKYVQAVFPLNELSAHIRKVSDEYGKQGEAIQKVQQVFDPVTEAMINGFKRLDDTAANFWKNLLTGSKNSFDALKQFALETLAEIIHAYTTKRIVLNLAGIFGLGGGLAGSAASAGSSLFGPGSLAQSGSFLSGNNLTSLPFFGGPNGIAALGSDALSFFGFSGAAGSGGLSSLAGAGISGLAGLGGNFVANSLFGDRPGKHSDIGGSIGAAIGTAILPGIGTAIGAVFGNFFGGLFGRSPVPPQGNLLSSTTQYGNVPGSSDGARFAFNLPAEGPFGFVGFENIKTKGDPLKADKLQEAAQGIAQLDTAIASFLSADEIAAVKAGLDGMTTTFQSGALDLESAVRERLSAIIGIASSDYAALIDQTGFSVDQVVQQLATVKQIESILDTDPFAAYASAVEESGRSLWEAAGLQKDALLDLASAFDGSIEQTGELALATQAAFDTIINILAAIDQVSAAAANSFSATAKGFRDFALTDEEKLQNTFSELLRIKDLFGSLIDPAEIAEQAGQFNSLLNEFFNLLPEGVVASGETLTTLADKLAGDFAIAEEAGESFRDFVKRVLGFDPADFGIETKEDAANFLAGIAEEANRQTQARLDAAREETKAQAEAIKTAVQDGMAAAAATIEAAGGTMQRAASQIDHPVDVNVTVDTRGGGSVAVTSGIA